MIKIIAELTVNFAKKVTIESVIKRSNYDEINFLVKEGIRKKRLSLQNEICGERKIVLVGVDNSISSQEVLIEAIDMGLNRPTYGDAFLLGEQYPNEQISGGPIVFLHDPQYSWGAYFFNLVLNVNDSKGRSISLVSSGGSWSRRFRFAFRRK